MLTGYACTFLRVRTRFCGASACRCKETGEAKVILTTLCGHGHFDMSSYAKYLDGGLKV
jgi:predicted alternative tryptophan synthase beta-subunit